MSNAIDTVSAYLSRESGTLSTYNVSVLCPCVLDMLLLKNNMIAPWCRRVASSDSLREGYANLGKMKPLCPYLKTFD